MTIVTIAEKVRREDNIVEKVRRNNNRVKR